MLRVLLKEGYLGTEQKLEEKLKEKVEASLEEKVELKKMEILQKNTKIK
jgi:hypothetical protein